MAGALPAWLLPTTLHADDGKHVGFEVGVMQL